MAHWCSRCRRNDECIIARGLENTTAHEAIADMAFRAQDEQGYPGSVTVLLSVDECGGYQQDPQALMGMGIPLVKGTLLPDEEVL